LNRRANQIAVALATGALLAGCGGDDDSEESSGLPEGCEQVQAPAPKKPEASDPSGKLSGPATAVVETSCGSFEIALDTEISPRTTASFANLAEQGFYDGTSFHRIARNFVVQGGDPLGDGTGGPGYSVDEQPPDDTSYLRGTVAMAKSAAEPPGRSGSQFFIVTAPADAGLPPDYAVLGEITEGFETVERIEELGEPDGSDAPPTAPVVIERITIERR
jgi:peptidyl-prolyl cis-trans isomerase B (cyclophilin B)